MYAEKLIGRRIMNTKSKKVYRIRHLPKKYGDDAINAGHYYLPITRLGTKENIDNVLHINKRTYKKYLVLNVLNDNKDEEATKLLHDITCNLN